MDNIFHRNLLETKTPWSYHSTNIRKSEIKELKEDRKESDQSWRSRPLLESTWSPTGRVAALQDTVLFRSQRSPAAEVVTFRETRPTPCTRQSASHGDGWRWRCPRAGGLGIVPARHGPGEVLDGTASLRVPGAGSQRPPPGPRGWPGPGGFADCGAVFQVSTS